MKSGGARLRSLADHRRRTFAAGQVIRRIAVFGAAAVLAACGQTPDSTEPDTSTAVSAPGQEEGDDEPPAFPDAVTDASVIPCADVADSLGPGILAPVDDAAFAQMTSWDPVSSNCYLVWAQLPPGHQCSTGWDDNLHPGLDGITVRIVDWSGLPLEEVERIPPDNATADIESFAQIIAGDAQWILDDARVGKVRRVHWNTPAQVNPDHEVFGDAADLDHIHRLSLYSAAGQYVIRVETERLLMNTPLVTTIVGGPEEPQLEYLTPGEQCLMDRGLLAETSIELTEMFGQKPWIHRLTPVVHRGLPNWAEQDRIAMELMSSLVDLMSPADSTRDDAEVTSPSLPIDGEM